MVDAALLSYVGVVTLLFFFWAYGILAFVRDVKNKLLPWMRQYRAKRAERAEEEEREQRERELY